MPAILLQIGNGQSGDSNRTRPLFGMNTRMTGDSRNHNLDVISTGRSDPSGLGSSAIPVEAQLGISQIRDLHMTRPEQTDLFLNGPEERDGRMWQVRTQDFQQRIEQHGDAGPIVGA